jgi:hypothetical protein
MYDIIGDIHGQAGSLTTLLKKLGYSKTKEGFQHSERKAIFVGDLINKGSESIEVLKLVRKMVDNKQAQVVLGNHELNFILHFYANAIHPNTPLMWSKGYGYFHRLYSEFNFDTQKVREWVNWCKTLPLVIETDDFRVVHACWHEPSIQLLKTISPDLTINDKVLTELFKENTPLLESLFILTKGIEVMLPKYVPLSDKKLSRPGRAKIQWWKVNNETHYLNLAVNPKKKFPNIEIPIPRSLNKMEYTLTEKPLFMGHYNLNRAVDLIQPNIAILDYNLKKKQHIVAYRWDGDDCLSKTNLIVN